MGTGPGLELAGAVARGDVRRREPESQGGPEPSDRSRDRQEESESKKTEEQEAAATRCTRAGEAARARRWQGWRPLGDSASRGVAARPRDDCARGHRAADEGGVAPRNQSEIFQPYPRLWGRPLHGVTSRRDDRLRARRL